MKKILQSFLFLLLSVLFSQAHAISETEAHRIVQEKIIDFQNKYQFSQLTTNTIKQKYGVGYFRYNEWNQHFYERVCTVDLPTTETFKGEYLNGNFYLRPDLKKAVQLSVSKEGEVTWKYPVIDWTHVTYSELVSQLDSYIACMSKIH